MKAAADPDEILPRAEPITPGAAVTRKQKEADCFT